MALGISRTQAFITTEVFLHLHCLELTVDPLELVQQLEAVPSPEDRLDATTDRVEAWLRVRAGPRSGSSNADR